MNMKVAQSGALVFFASLFFSVLMLVVERTAGIGWDYHPDSVTYATNSLNMATEILSGDLWLVFNNGYYLWCYVLGENIYLVTLVNMLMYSVSNVILYSFHSEYFRPIKIGWYVKAAALMLLLLNPYRLHLSTTMLKDTLIILLMIVVATRGLGRGLMLLPVLMLIRVASALYILVHLRKRYLLWIFVLMAAVLIAFPQMFTERLMEFNEAEMQLRDFDRIPTFQELGLVGIAARGIVWPLLAVTGIFAVISPALAFFPVAIGSVFNQLYCYWATGRLCFPSSAFLAMSIFAIMVTGFTAYIRYVYPLLVIMPIMATKYRIDYRAKGRVRSK